MAALMVTCFVQQLGDFGLYKTQEGAASCYTQGVDKGKGQQGFRV